MQNKNLAKSNPSFALTRLAVVGLATLSLCVAANGCSDDDDDDGGSSMAGGGMTESNLDTAGSGGTGMMTAGGMGGMGMATASAGLNPLANGLTVPDGVFDWRVIGAITRGDNGQARVVVGNDMAVDAARAGETNPWPDGSMIAHYVWSGGTNPLIAGAVVPENFGALTLMVKDSVTYADDGGWAYGLWTGENLAPATVDGDGNPFDQGCINCHTDNVADNDFVFTEPGQLPTAAAFAAANDAPNGVSLPDNFANWRVLGFADRSTPEGGTFRVLLGNDLAVDAARSGQTNPWPDGSMMGHIVWAPGSNTATDAVLSGPSVVPGDFRFVTLMEKDSVRLQADGGWAYSVWSGLDLTPPDALNAEGVPSDQVCIDCHTDNVASNDYVFTVPGPLPSL